APCRLVDTRQGLPLSSGTARSFPVTGVCGVPSTARAAYFNTTVVNPTAGGYLRLFPQGQGEPPTSTVSFQTGQTRANNTIMGLSTDGRVGATAYVGSGQTHLVLDVTGYFAEPEALPMIGMWQGTLASYASELTISRDASGFRARLFVHLPDH